MSGKFCAVSLILCFCLSVPVIAQTEAGIRIPAIQKVDQSSRESLARSFILSVLNDKPALMWECFCPDTKILFEAKAESGNEKPEEVKYKFCAFFKLLLQKDLAKQKDLNKLVMEVKPSLIQIENKWYFSIMPELQSCIPEIKKIDYSSQAALIKSFILAALNGKKDLLWECIDPEVRMKWVNSARGKKKDINEFKTKICRKVRTRLLKELFVRHSGNFTQMLDAVTKEKFPVRNIKGMWYLDLK